MIDASLSSFQSYQVIKYEQSNELIKSIKKEIIPSIKETLSNHTNEENNIIKQVKKENQTLLENLEKLKKVFKYFSTYFYSF